MIKKEPYEKIKADLPECALEGCKRIGVLLVYLYDMVTVSTIPDNEYKSPQFRVDFCCKTHMLRYFGKVRLPRYSKKRMQALAGTEPLRQIETKDVRKARVRKSKCVGKVVYKDGVLDIEQCGDGI